MDNPGLKKGLAVSFNYDQRVADIARQNDQMRQAKLYAENQAKMMAEDFEYNNAMNAWDNTQVKQYAQGKIKELGSFIRENPDYKYNLDKRIIYNNLKRELKDNPYLNAGMQVDANIKAMQAYMNDPKNAPLVQSEEFTPIKQQYENYLKTGSIDGNTANRKLFTFTPPEELVDTTPMLSKYASMAAQNGKDTKWLAKGAGSIHQFVSDTDKALAAEGAINDKVLGKHLQREYNDYVAKLGEGQPPMSIKQYVVAKMQPYFKGDEYKNFSYATGDGGAGKGQSAGTRNFYKELIDRARAASGVNKVVAADPDGVNQVLTGGKGVLNTNGLLFEASPGNFIPFAGSLTKNYTTSGTKAKYDQDGLKTSVTVQMPLRDFEASLNNADVIDYPTWGTGWLGNESTVKKGWEDKVKIATNENGEKVAEFELWAPMEGTNTNTAGGYNHGMHAKAEAITSDFESNNTWSTPDGVQWQVGADGNAYGSNGQVFSPEGKQLK